MNVIAPLEFELTTISRSSTSANVPQKLSFSPTHNGAYANEQKDTQNEEPIILLWIGWKQKYNPTKNLC